MPKIKSNHAKKTILSYIFIHSYLDIVILHEFQILEDKWEPCHEREIDITDQPKKFILEFLSTGITGTRISDFYNSKVALLDSLEWKNNEIVTKPMYDSKPSYYLQRILIEIEGETRIEFSISAKYNNQATVILVRH